jgi:hypothetical protein
MMVDGKWSFVRKPQTQANDNGAAEGNGADTAGGEDATTTRVIRIHLAQLRGGDPRQNIVIRSGDVLISPQPLIGEFYMMGNINRPGVYSLSNRQITLTQAIASAGGFGPLAVPSRVQIIRRIGEGQQQMYFVNAKEIIEGRADDILLKPNDVINIGSSGWAPFLAVFRNAFRATYGVGFVYDRNLVDPEHEASHSFP